MLRLHVERGGEKWVSLAKNKLAELKAWMRSARVPAFSKWIYVGTTDKIFLNVLEMGNGLTSDTIRITVAGGVWDFYFSGSSASYTAEQIVADPVVLAAFAASFSLTVAELEALAVSLGITLLELVTAALGGGTFGEEPLYLGEVGGKVSRIAGDVTLLAARSLDKPFGLFSDAGQWKVVDPKMKVSRVRDGEFDALSLASVDVGSALTVNESTWSAIFASGSDGILASAEATLTIPSYTSYTSKRLLSSLDDFYFVGIVSSEIEVFSLNSGTKLLDITDASGLLVPAQATHYDVLAATFAIDGDPKMTEINIYSAKFGLLASYVPVVSGGPVGSVTPAAFSTTTDTDFFVFALESSSNAPFEPGFSDRSYFVYSAIRCAGVFDGEGVITGYTVSRAVVTFLAGAGSGAHYGAVATKDNAVLFFLLTDEAATTNEFKMLDGNGNAAVLDANAGDTASGKTLVAATRDKAVLAVVVPTDFGTSPQSIRFYDSLGGVIETGLIAAPAYPATSFLTAGNHGTVAYFTVDGTGTQKYLVGSDASVIDMKAALPVFSSGGTVSAFHTDADTIYGLAGGEVANPEPPPTDLPAVYHVTQVPDLHEYTVAASGTVFVPTRSNILAAQEFDEWS